MIAKTSKDKKQVFDIVVLKKLDPTAPSLLLYVFISPFLILWFTSGALLALAHKLHHSFANYSPVLWGSITHSKCPMISFGGTEHLHLSPLVQPSLRPCVHMQGVLPKNQTTTLLREVFPCIWTFKGIRGQPTGSPALSHTTSSAKCSSRWIREKETLTETSKKHGSGRFISTSLYKKALRLGAL